MASILLGMIIALFGACIYKETASDLPRILRRVFLGLIVVLISCCITLMIRSSVVHNAHSVATLCATSERDEKTLFKENDTGKYFVIIENPWNPFETTYREYIDTEIAEEYIEKYNELKEFDFAFE